MGIPFGLYLPRIPGLIGNLSRFSLPASASCLITPCRMYPNRRQEGANGSSLPSEMCRNCTGDRYTLMVWSFNPSSNWPMSDRSSLFVPDLRPSQHPISVCKRCSFSSGNLRILLECPLLFPKKSTKSTGAVYGIYEPTHLGALTTRSGWKKQVGSKVHNPALLRGTKMPYFMLT